MFKTVYCWWHVRLARHVKELEYISVISGNSIYQDKMEFIGWVWLQRVPLTNNLNHGWVAFLDDNPMQPICKKCGQIIPNP